MAWPCGFVWAPSGTAVEQGEMWEKEGTRRERESWNISSLKGHTQQLCFYSGDDGEVFEGENELSCRKVAPMMV